MGRGGSDEDRCCVDRNRAQPMPENDSPRAKALPSRTFEVGKHRPGQRQMRLVIERTDRSTARAVGTDPTREHDDPTEAGPLQDPHRRGEGERSSCEANAHSQPPPYGGCTANSSPGRTLVVRVERVSDRSGQIDSTGGSGRVGDTIPPKRERGIARSLPADPPTIVTGAFPPRPGPVANRRTVTSPTMRAPIGRASKGCGHFYLTEPINTHGRSIGA